MEKLNQIILTQTEHGQMLNSLLQVGINPVQNDMGMSGELDQFSFPLSTNDDINNLEIQLKSIAAKKRFGNLLI